MATIIPQMDQKIIEKYFPGQAVEKSMRTPLKSMRGYTFKDNYGLIITTEKLKSVMALYASQITLNSIWNTSLNMEGSHLVCLLIPRK